MMFRILRKKATPGDFGQLVAHYSREFINHDALMAVRMVHYDIVGRIENPHEYLQSKGFSQDMQRIYGRIYTHCTLQAISTQFNSRIRYEFVKGGVSLFKKDPHLYDFDEVYDRLHRSYRSEHVFRARIEALGATHDEARELRFLPRDMNYVGLSNAKLLIDEVIINNVYDSSPFIREFDSFHSVVNSTIGTAQRALNIISKSYRMMY